MSMIQEQVAQGYWIVEFRVYDSTLTGPFWGGEEVSFDFFRREHEYLFGIMCVRKGIYALMPLK